MKADAVFKFLGAICFLLISAVIIYWFVDQQEIKMEKQEKRDEVSSYFGKTNFIVSDLNSALIMESSNSLISSKIELDALVVPAEVTEYHDNLVGIFNDAISTLNDLNQSRIEAENGDSLSRGIALGAAIRVQKLKTAVNESETLKQELINKYVNVN
jgi:hypothetical protein